MSINWSNYFEIRPYYTQDDEQLKIKKLKNFFINNNIKFSNYSILEVGAGHGIFTNIFLSLFKKITSIEPNLELYKKLNEKYDNKKLIKYNKSFENFKSSKKYDMIIFMNVFLFVENKNKVLIKLSKMLNSRKYVIIMEPARFINLNNKSLNKKLMKDTIISINKSKKFELIHYGFILNGLICYILKKI